MKVEERKFESAPYRKELRDFHSFQKQKSCWKISNIETSHPFRWSCIFSEGTVVEVS